MRSWLPWILLASALALFAHNVVLLGGLARHPTLGPPALAAAERESPWLRAQMTLGRWLADRGLFAADGLEAAERVFAPREQGVAQAPEAALDLLLRPGLGWRHGLLRVGQWLAPLAFLAAILLFAFAPRQVQLIGTRRG
jgi:hypothetical protein